MLKYIQCKYFHLSRTRPTYKQIWFYDNFFDSMNKHFKQSLGWWNISWYGEFKCETIEKLYLEEHKKVRDKWLGTLSEPYIQNKYDNN